MAERDALASRSALGAILVAAAVVGSAVLLAGETRPPPRPPPRTVAVVSPSATASPPADVRTPKPTARASATVSSLPAARRLRLPEGTIFVLETGLEPDGTGSRDIDVIALPPSGLRRVLATIPDPTLHVQDEAGSWGVLWGEVGPTGYIALALRDANTEQGRALVFDLASPDKGPVLDVELPGGASFEGRNLSWSPDGLLTTVHPARLLMHDPVSGEVSEIKGAPTPLSARWVADGRGVLASRGDDETWERVILRRDGQVEPAPDLVLLAPVAGLVPFDPDGEVFRGLRTTNPGDWFQDHGGRLVHAQWDVDGSGVLGLAWMDDAIEVTRLDRPDARVVLGRIPVDDRLGGALDSEQARFVVLQPDGEHVIVAAGTGSHIVWHSTRTGRTHRIDEPTMFPFAGWRAPRGMGLVEPGDQTGSTVAVLPERTDVPDDLKAVLRRTAWAEGIDQDQDGVGQWHVGTYHDPGRAIPFTSDDFELDAAWDRLLGYRVVDRDGQPRPDLKGKPEAHWQFFEIDPSSGELRVLHQAALDASPRSVTIDRSGRWLYYVTDLDGLHEIDLDSGRDRALVPDRDDFDRDRYDFTWSPSGRFLASGLCELSHHGDGACRTEVVRVGTHEVQRLRGEFGVGALTDHFAVGRVGWDDGVTSLYHLTSGRIEPLHVRATHAESLDGGGFLLETPLAADWNSRDISVFDPVHRRASPVAHGVPWTLHAGWHTHFRSDRWWLLEPTHGCCLTRVSTGGRFSAIDIATGALVRDVAPLEPKRP